MLQRSINTHIWADEWFEQLKPTEKLLWIYLLTNSQTNMLGIYEISKRRISFETGINQADIEKALESFGRVRKAFFINGYVFLCNWMKNQKMNTNMMKSAEAKYKELPKEVISWLKENGSEGFESLSNGLVMVPKIEVEVEGEIEVEVEKENEKKLSGKNPLFSRFIESYNNFILNIIGVPAKIDGAQGNAIKSITKYLKNASKNKSDQGALDAWNFILDNYGLWDDFHQRQTKATQINSNITNILNSIKNGKSGKKAQSIFRA